jgi:hypothetical protein
VAQAISNLLAHRTVLARIEGAQRREFLTTRALSIARHMPLGPELPTLADATARSRRLPPGAISTPTRALVVKPMGCDTVTDAYLSAITDHRSHTDHYCHISQLRTSMRRPAPGKV